MCVFYGGMEAGHGADRVDVWLTEAPPADQPMLTLHRGDHQWTVPQSAADVVRRAADVSPGQSLGVADAMRILQSTPTPLLTGVDSETATRAMEEIEHAGGRCELRAADPGLLVLDPRSTVDVTSAPTPELAALVRSLAALEARAKQHERSHPIDVEAFLEASRAGDAAVTAFVSRYRFDGGDDLADALIDAYRDADAPGRIWLRDQVSQLEAVRGKALGRIGREARRFDAGDAAASIEPALVAVCVTDLEPDYRDTYMALGALWLAAARRGIDPAPSFGAVSALAASERTRAFLAGFTSSAFYASSIAPNL